MAVGPEGLGCLLLGRQSAALPSAGREHSSVSTGAAGSTSRPVRVGVLGDWGTGEPEALAVLEALMHFEARPDHPPGRYLLRGNSRRVPGQFPGPDPGRPPKVPADVPVYSIPGNHDYHCGGGGFYAMVPQLNQGIPNASVQVHSFLCLRNEHWQLECLDTGYNDHDLLKAAADTTTLRPDEAAWHQKQLSEAGPRQVILLSHHQLFSAFTTIGASGTSFQNPRLIKNLQDCALPGRPTSRGGFGATSMSWKSTRPPAPAPAACPYWADASVTGPFRSSTTPVPMRRRRVRRHPTRDGLAVPQWIRADWR